MERTLLDPGQARHRRLRAVAGRRGHDGDRKSGRRAKHEVDVLALPSGERPQSPRATIALIGEAKATVQPRGPKDLGGYWRTFLPLVF
ncbi:hypothetical protein ACWEO4_07160 [Streptomyces sp. NPDC004393]